jgi:putative hydrolase of the HAD superfamily
MTGGRTHIFLDFFGTLVDYSDSRTEQGYHRSHDVLRGFGAELTYEEMLETWTRISDEFDRETAEDEHEYSLTELGGAFLAEVLGRHPTSAQVEVFTTSYLTEWNTGVIYPRGITGLIEGLALRYRLAVVSNTLDSALVPRHLTDMGVLPFLDAVITSVDVGWRKPHPKIFEAALNAVGAEPSDVVFVGDSYRADYLGAQRAGMRAYLIDPQRWEPVPEGRRLRSVFDLPARLAGLA